LTKVIGIPAGVAVAGLIVPIMMLMQNSSANIAALQNALDTTNQVTNQKLAQKQELNKSINELNQEVAAAKTAYDKLKLSLDSLATQQEIVSGDLAVALSKVPYGLTLDNISESGGNLTIGGKAPRESDLLAYARNLDLSGRFSSTTISSITIDPPADEQSEGYVEFTLNLQRKG
jgi:Tfp pilus assembly protein PilN